LVGSSVSRSPDDLGSGDDRLSDLVRPGVWMALAQLAVAFVVLALARGIRPGRPVEERSSSPLEGSEAVRARGTMMRRARHSARAGWLLRSELHRELCDRYRVGRASTPEELDAAAVERDGITPGAVATLLSSETPDPASLLDLSNRIARLRTTWLHDDRTPATAAVAARPSSGAATPDADAMDPTLGEDS
jgi:hypothetical protein